MRRNIVFEPRLERFDPDILEAIVEIEAYRRSIMKLPIPPRMRAELNRLNIVRQIKGTTGIEGNTLTEEEIDRIVEAVESGEPANGGERPSIDQLEAINAHRVVQYVREQAESNPQAFITEDLIRRLHLLTTEGCNYPNNNPGVYRSHQNVVGSYTPPEPTEVPRLMKEFVEFINSRQAREGYGPLIRAILAHFYLVSIHPFGDGNGRTARALEALILYCGGYNVRGFYSLANFYYKNRASYIDQLQDARFRYNGNLTEFVRFSLGGFLQELESVQGYILDFVTRVLFKDYVEELAGHGKISWRASAVLDYMIREHRSIGSREFRSKEHYILEIVYRNYRGTKTLIRDLKQMFDCGLLVEEDEELRPNYSIMRQFAE